jgi:glycosyltransferase involved in cell wall biosynthesis
VKTGISRTSGEYLVIIDADNEYKVSDLTKLIEAAQLTGANLILGSRYIKSQPMRKISNSKIISLYFNTGHHVFTFYFNLLFKSNLRDPATMWKLMEGRFVRSLNLTGNGFNLDFELVAAHIKLNKAIIEVPISYCSRGPEDGKKIKLLVDPIIWVFSFAVYAFRKPKNYLKLSIKEEPNSC